MPYKKRTKKRPTYRRKRYRKTAINKQVVSRSPLPNSFKTTLRYCDNLTLDPGTGGTIAGDVLGANITADPYVAAGGHQPRGYDQFMAMYNHCTVIGSRILCQFVNTDAANAVQCGIALRASPTLETNLVDYIEQGNCSYRICGTSDGTNSVSVKHSFNNKFLGISKPLSNTAIRNSHTNNCDEIAYYQVFVASPTGAADPTSVLVQLSIEYVCVFTEPRDLLSS